jgi:hypothetical protein
MVFAVSDFGMAASLAGGNDDTDYAASYVKLGGEVGVAFCLLSVAPSATPHCLGC